MSTRLKIALPVLALLFLSSCITFVKKYPKNKPFVYDTKINLVGNLSKQEKSNLLSGLNSQLEDSITAKRKQNIFWEVIKKPPVFDSSSANKSVVFMKSYLNSSGYFQRNVSWTPKIDTVGNQLRTTITFNVTPGPVTHIDSVWYSLRVKEIQRLADSASKIDTTAQKIDSATLGVNQPLQKLLDSANLALQVRKGSTFSQDTISQDIDKVVQLFRNNGYMRFTREGLIAVWDTVDAELLKPAIDPLEQIELIEKLKQRRLDPTATIEFRVKPDYDSTRLIKYYIGKVIIYPDFDPEKAADSAANSVAMTTVEIDSTFIVKYNNKLFVPKILPENFIVRHGQAYNENRYLLSVNRFNTLGAWKLVTIDKKPRPGTDTVDFIVRLIPAIKYLFTSNIEFSQNITSNPLIPSNLFGVALNVNLQNRNFAKRAIQTNTSLRYGTELNLASGNRLVNSRQVSAGYNIFFPRIVPKIKFLPQQYRLDAKTFLAFNIGNTQRLDYYNISNFSTSYGYQLRNRNKALDFRPINIEYNYLNSKHKLDSIFEKHPELRTLFTDGLITTWSAVYTINLGTNNNITTLKFGLETSFPYANLLRLFKSPFIDTNSYNFHKFDVEYKRLMKIKANSEFVVRVFTGLGITGHTVNPQHSQHLPFFKAYGVGGPNSMRGWGLRRLGPGSTVAYFNALPDRFGDLQFETNLEYRFHAFNWFGFKFNSVLFTDIGNVWFLRKNDAFPGGDFKPKYFLRDLGVDAGTGLRVDLGFFLIRLDYAFKVRNPSPEPINQAAQYKWFYGWNLKTLVGGTMQFGVTYPF